MSSHNSALKDKQKEDFKKFIDNIVPVIKEMLSKTGDASPAAFLDSTLYGQVIICSDLNSMQNYESKAAYVATVMGLGATIPDLDKVAWLLPTYTIDMEHPGLIAEVGSSDQETIYKYVKEKYPKFVDCPYNKEIITITVDALLITAFATFEIERKSDAVARLKKNSLNIHYSDKNDPEKKFYTKGLFTNTLEQTIKLAALENKEVELSAGLASRTEITTAILSKGLGVNLDRKWMAMLRKSRRHLKARKSKRFSIN